MRWQENRAKESGASNWDWTFHYLDALNALYPTEIWGHGENNFFCIRFKFALDALVTSGELEEIEGGSRYKILPAALNSLSEMELEKSRHQDSEKQAKWLVVLTGVIALFAIVEAFQF